MNNSEKKFIDTKKILDKWATAIVPKQAIYLNKDKEAQIDQKYNRHYEEEGYQGDEVLWIPPKDCIRFEFEDTPTHNHRFILEMESAAKSLGFDYCITGHKGKSDYFNMFNIKGIPLTDDNQTAKLLLADLLMSSKAKDQLDRTNLGWTLSPIIGHEHWKPKYNGSIHKILRGKNPVEHKNEYPKELLKQLKKAKKWQNNHIVKTKQTANWVEDFLLNYCCTKELPKGSRHFKIEKNLAAFVMFRKDKEEIKKNYYNAQGRKHDSLRTWELAIAKGDYKDVSTGELAKYIKDHGLPYDIPIEKSAEEKIKETPITQKELELLREPNLLENINKEFDKQIVGQKEERMTIFANACGKYVSNNQIASFNLCINSESGAGKDYTVKNVLKIFPKSNLVSRSRISPAVFTYWHNSKYEPNWTWDGKICYLSDVSNQILNHDVFKLMCSDGTHSTIVIQQQAVDIEIKGKPVMFITTASASPNNEMLRRFPFLELDETEKQTIEIKKKQAKAAEEGISLEYDFNITNALAKLKKVKVKIPFASKLVKHFPSDHLIMRTHFHRFLDYIKSSAALHQYQRETDEEGFILADTKDYDFARIPLKKTTSNPFMIPLSKKQKMILEEAEKLDDFSVKEIEPKIPFLVQSKLYDALAKLQELGFLSSYYQELDNSKRPVRKYKFINLKHLDIPTWKEIESCRKKGIKGIEGSQVNKGNKGNNKENSSITNIQNNKDNLSKNTKNNNSPNSLNSPPNSCLEAKKIIDFIEKNDNGRGISFELIQQGLSCDEEELDKMLKKLSKNANVYSKRAGFWSIL